MNQTLIRFTEGPALDAVVRLDLQAEPAKVGAAGLSVGAPQLESDPESPTVSWGNRRITLTQYVEGSKADARPVLAALARELLRSRNWLLVRFSPASTPVWFHTYRTQPGDIDLEQVYDSESKRDVWQIQVQLEADPWAYGERVTQPAATVSNDPAGASNPCLLRLPEILGDAPTPLRIYATGVPFGNGQFLGSLAVEDGAVADTYVKPLAIHSWNVGADTTAVSDSAFIGGAKHAVTFSTTPGMATRLYGDDLSVVIGSGSLVSAGALAAGRYRVLMRVGNGATNGTFQVRLGQKSGTDYVWNDTATLAVTDATARKHYLDLGEIAVPFGNPMTPDLAKTYLPDEPALAVQAARTAGSGSLDLDDLILVPVELTSVETFGSTMAFVHQGVAIGGTGDAVYYDGEEDRVSLVELTGDDVLANTTSPAAVRGSLPVAHPGAANLLHFFRSVAGDTLTATSTLTVSYAPRYLWLGND